MRKIFASLIIMVLAAMSLHAIVAPKTPYQYTQPDGSVITLVNHGDEFHSWTTCGETVVALQPDGFWRPVQNPDAAMRASAESIRRRAEAQQMYMSQRGIGMGTKKFVVLLIEFSDLSFTVSNPQQAFSNLLNQEGYSLNGATGSARDYYIDQSRGQFKPTFDVYGPVKVDKSYTYYGKQVTSGGSTVHDEHAREALYDALSEFDKQINFKDYDADGDGYVDMVFFFFAGHNQAEGGSVDSIWPHASYLAGYNAYYDGVRVYRYACTSEYRGASGTTMAGIGTFCHEYGHVLGLPDFYDTDYATNGTARDLGNVSLMSSGGYNNNGRTPPSLNAEERVMLEWMSSPQSITSSGNYSINSIADNDARIINTSNSDEYFLLETRDGTKWDSYLYPGLYIYHVDKSNNIVTGSTTAKYLWSYNRQKLNCYAVHPCFYVLYSGGNSNSGNIPFPGRSNVTTYNPVAWSEEPIPFVLQDIAFSGGSSTFYVQTGSTKTVSGKVTDMDGNAIEGATILMAPKGQSAPGRITTNSVQRRDASYSAVSSSDGTYKIELDENDNGADFEITASAGGFFNRTLSLTVTSLFTTCDFVLRSVGSSSDYDLIKYDPSASFRGLGYNQTSASIMGGVSYSASEVARYAGMKLTNVTFQISTDAVDAIYLVVEAGSTRLLTKQITDYDLSKSISVNIESDNVIIPGGQELRIAYALNNARNSDGSSGVYPLVFENNSPKDGGFIYSSYNLDSPSWNSYSGNLLISAHVFDPSSDIGGGNITLANLGYNVINDPGEGSYKAGTVLPLSIIESSIRKPSSVSWYMDDTSVRSGSVTLSAGKHILRARLTYADGSVEDLYLAIDVK